MSLNTFPGGGEAYALIAPLGTAMVFCQPTAPFGWVQNVNATVNDASLRLNSGTGGGFGGSVSWSAWNFGGSFSTNAFTIAVGNLPPHSHTIPDPGHAHSLNDPTHVHNMVANAWTAAGGGGVGWINGNSTSGPQGIATAAAATGMSMNAALTGITATTNTGSGGALAPTYTTPLVKFVDFILANKS